MKEDKEINYWECDNGIEDDNGIEGFDTD